MANSQQTQRQSTGSVFSSIGSGMQSLIGSSGRRYYVLEHKVGSLYHKSGEAQKIIVDQIELGRGSNCQVRFDENFATVSRSHASIVKDGDNWKIIPLSATNPTLVNGVKIEGAWYLQNGDEIQLSTSGPKLGFILPAGNNGLVKSIGLTQRMSLFRQQALMPYKKALWGIAGTILALIVVGCYVINSQGKVIKEQGELIARSQELIQQQEKTIKNLGDENKQQELAIAAQNEIASMQQKIRNQKNVSVPSVIEPFKDDIYYIVGGIYVDGELLHIPVLNEEGDMLDERGRVVNSPEDAAWTACAWSGTAFMLSDGKLVTARHCVTPWRFDMLVAQMIVPDRHLEAVITAYSRSGDVIQFTSSQCVMDSSDDSVIGYLDNGQSVMAFTPGRENDWAYYYTSRRGHMSSADRKSVANIKAGEQLYVMGYPASLGADSPDHISPIYATASKARDGLDGSGMILISGGVQGGNSGGPVFAEVDGEIKVVGIVSTMIRGGNYGQATPITRIK